MAGMPSPPPSTSTDEEHSLLCSLLITERRSALAENYESEPAFASETGQEVRRGGGGGGGRNRKRADGGSVNEVNGKNGKGENQSREREEIRVAGLKIVRWEKRVGGAVGNAWQVESGEKKRSAQLESVE